MKINLDTILAPNHCFVDSDCTSQKSIIEKLSKMIASDLPNVGYRYIFQEIMEREKLGSTAVGHGVAIPHTRSKYVNSPTAAFAKLDQAIDFKAEDAENVDLVFCLVVPLHVEKNHLNILATLASTFDLEDNRTMLRQINDNTALRTKLIELSE